MMDDPLFDPWGPAAEPEPMAPPAAPAEDPAPARWRSPAAPRSVQRIRPAPQPLDVPPVVAALGEPAEPARRAPASEPHDPQPVPVHFVPPEPPAPSPSTTALRELVLPRLRSVARRLEAWGHCTLIDDRTGAPPPSLRFQIRPRRGPFDGGEALLGPTLEILLDETENDAGFTTHVWLDPMATSPSERRSVPDGRLSEDRVDEVLVDFVERALRGS